MASPKQPNRKPSSRSTRSPLPNPPDGNGHAAAPPAAPFTKPLPFSEDAERALLGCMLLEHTAISEALTILKDAGADAFFFPSHRKLYEHIVGLFEDNRPIDGVLIKEELERRNLFDELGGYDFLASLVGAVPSALRVRQYAELVREKYLLRRLIQATSHVVDVAYEQQLPVTEVLDLAEKEIFDVTEQRVTSGSQTLPDLINEVFQQLQDRGDAALTGQPTGYYELDEMLCGLQPAELIIIAARPSMGKTALGLNMAEHLALNEGRPALFFSLEMSRQQVAQRILCSRARVNSHKLRRGRIGPADLDQLHAAADEMSGCPLFVDDTSQLSVLELRARARMAWRKHGIKAIFVDYLQLMRSPGEESRQAEVASISRGLKALAKELEVPVVAMAQLNRNPEDRSDNRPRMSDLRESGAIEQDADVILLLHRESYYQAADQQAADEQVPAQLIIAKQRNGPVGTVDLHFNKMWTRFDNPHTGVGLGNVYEAHNASTTGDVSFP